VKIEAKTIDKADSLGIFKNLILLTESSFLVIGYVVWKPIIHGVVDFCE